MASATDSEREIRYQTRRISLISLRLAGASGAVLGLLLAVAAYMFDALSPIVAASSALLSAVATYFVAQSILSTRLRRASVIVDELRAMARARSEKRRPGSDELDELLGQLERTVDGVEATIVQLNKIENYRQEFLGDVSHELQTPIYAIQGFSETLLDGALEDDGVNRSFVEKITKHAKRLSALVNDLSDISQIETGSLKMRQKVFDPESLVRESIEALEFQAEQADIDLHLFVAPNAPLAIGDRERIRQVLLNLITNGIKYNEAGGRVEVAIRSAADRVLFTVTDDGIGIEPEHIERVTERFFRTDKSRSRERGGTGLGLAIVKHILEAHGTVLQINSRTGHGSTFGFSLKAADNENIPVPETMTRHAGVTTT